MSGSSPLRRQWLLLKGLSVRPGGWDVTDLAAELGSSVKTVRRDLALLREAGFPLAFTRQAHGRKTWRLEGDIPPRTMFDFLEAAALYLGRRFLDPLAGSDLWHAAQGAYRKIRLCLNETALRHLERMASAVHITAVGPGEKPHRADLIDTVLVAIEDRRPLSLTYRAEGRDAAETYVVHPYGAVFHRHALYLVAFAPHRGAIRHYKLDRVAKAQPAAGSFARPDDFRLEEHLRGTFGVYQSDGEPRQVRVRFAAEAARYVAEAKWHPSQALRWEADGGLVATFRLMDLTEVRKWILSFGPSAVALAPAELVEAVRQDLRAALEVYQKYEPLPKGGP